MQRTLTDYESRLIELLLAQDFPGRDELKLQLKDLEAIPAGDKDNYGSILLKPHESKRAAVETRVPVEGEYIDSDNVPVSVLLHVVDGYLHELEVFKADGSDILERSPDLRIEIK